MQALSGIHQPGAAQKLTALLEERYGGHATLVYKGREALCLAFKTLDLPKGSAVAISGFTCFAVYKAVESAGLEAHFMDIEPEQLNFSAATLAAAVESNPAIKAVVIQNTLGYACDIQGIVEVCRKHGIMLIEDLAHSPGIVYADGGEAGTVGDFVMLSFGRDKMIDAVSGGALVARNPKYQLKSSSRLPKPPLTPRFRDHLYPLLTAKIRFGYGFGIGKLVHAAYKALGLLSRSVDGEFYQGHRLPGWYCALTLKGFSTLESNLARRQRIAQVYAQTLQRGVQFLELPSQTPQASNLRFPIRVRHRDELIQYLAQQQIFIADTWYDAPIAPPRYIEKTTYQKGQCPGSEQVVAHILNLPTHRAISESDALNISEHINAWLKSK